MEQYTGTSLQLQNFEVDKVWDGGVDGVKTFILKGYLTNEVHKERCPFCGYRRMHSNGRRTTRLKHMAVGGFQIQVAVKYTRWECQVCHAFQGPFTRVLLRPQLLVAERRHREEPPIHQVRVPQRNFVCRSDPRGLHRLYQSYQFCA